MDSIETSHSFCTISPVVLSPNLVNGSQLSIEIISLVASPPLISDLMITWFRFVVRDIQKANSVYNRVAHASTQNA